MENDASSILDPTWVGHFLMITVKIKWGTFIISFIDTSIATGALCRFPLFLRSLSIFCAILFSIFIEGGVYEDLELSRRLVK